MGFFNTRTSDVVAWPPPAWLMVYQLYAEHDAWYSGDPMRLASFYSARAYTPTPRGKFWARKTDEERRVMLHVPVAGDIAATSAALLFSEHPRVRILDAESENASGTAIRAQSRLDEIIDRANVYTILLEAAEIASALGGVFLKVNWDKKLADFPMLSVAQPDNAIPEFTFGILTACTFWKVVQTDDGVTWRLFERHEPGRITNTLYQGALGDLGAMVGLVEHADTASLEPVIETGLDTLACRYIPNMRPNRQFRATYLGQSDYSGSEGLMDSIDEVFTSLVRDIRLGQGRIIAPESYFETDGFGDMSFDLDKEAYVGLDAMQSPGSGTNDNITVNQFAIRTTEHLDAATALCVQVITNAGYSPQTFGLNILGQAESGTALSIREQKSFATTAKKGQYWPGAIADLLEIMMIIDRTKLSGPAELFRPSVELQEGLPSDIRQVTSSVLQLSQARAASIETLVKMVHPDWEVGQVEEEKALILGEGAGAATTANG